MKIAFQLAAYAVAGAFALGTASARGDDSTRDDSARTFARMAPVLQSPRCMNCHTITDFPRQGDARREHFLNVRRGPENHGMAGMRCSTCHATHNQTAADVPGAPHWGLAPLSMGWEGKNVHALCLAVLDRSKNGNRNIAALVHHFSDDPLVGWAWHPGGTRRPPPVDKPHFRALVAHWAATGAACPA